MSALYHQYLVAEISFIKSEISLMRLLSNSDGFFQLYQSKLSETGNGEKAFMQLNLQYKQLFGSGKFESYDAFIRFYAAKGVLTTVGANLKQSFCDRGFNTLQSFMPLILHYYPEVGRLQIMRFWDGKPVKAKTLKLINYVKQIIG